MKIALTADLHLTSRDRYPQRYNALENILDQVVANKIEILIIAGDLFDQSQRYFGEFESICSNPLYRNINIYIIPGNHDEDLNASYFAVENIHVYTKPSLLDLDDGKFHLLLLPYSNEASMGDLLQELENDLDSNNWGLVSHGDWIEGLKDPNPKEPGIYMPLTSQDLRRFQPARVFLGHTHINSDRDNLHLIGSPCGLDISETGKRRFIVYDTLLDLVSSREVDTEHIYFDETFIMLPMEDEEAYIRREIEERIKSWNLEQDDNKKIRLRVKVKGYCSDRHKLMMQVKHCFKDFQFYMGKDPDISEVHIPTKDELRYVAEGVKTRLESLDWQPQHKGPQNQDILIAALNLIYGE